MDNQIKKEYTDLELLQMQMNKVQDESVESTRRMVTSCETTQRVGAQTMEELYGQGEQIRGIERNLDEIHGSLQETDKNLKKLHKGKSIFSPFKRAPKSYKSDVFKEPKGKSSPSTRSTGRDGYAQNSRHQKQAALPQEQTSSYQGRFITPILNDAREEEMENNLQQVHQMLGQINTMAVEMGQELTSQNAGLVRVDNKMVDNQARISSSQRSAEKFLGKLSKPESPSVSQKIGSAAAQAMLK